MNKFAVIIFLFLFFFLSLFVSGNVDSQDGQLYLAVARYIYYTGEPTAPPYEFNYEGTGKNIHMGTYIGKDGKTYSPTGLGYTLALLPSVALTDFIYKVNGLTVQLEHFPLESDWLTLMSASFINVFFGAGAGVVLFLYFKDLGLNERQSFILTLVSVFATNLWVYTKHSFAHMMFIFFLILSFYFIRRYLRIGRKVLLILSAACFGISTITYNQTFALSLIPLAAYYVLLSKFKFKKIWFKKAAKDLLIFTITYLPFLIIFVWFETLRIRVTTPGWSEDFVRQYSFLFGVPLSVFIEGVWGQLFSPGRSIFLYSPILILPIMFHHKIKRIYKPELFMFICISIIYLVFFASLYVIEDPKYGARGLWDGELSWGPRYLLVLIPFGMLVIAGIYKNLSNLVRLLVILPLVVMGVYVNFLGIVIPYQTKLQDLEPEIVINSQKYTHFSYSNLLPRYTPVLSHSQRFVNLMLFLPDRLSGSEYKVKFYNPEKTAWENWALRSRIYEQTPDFWWVMPIFYQDLPKSSFLILFLCNTIGLIFFAFQVVKYLRHDKSPKTVPAS